MPNLNKIGISELVTVVLLALLGILATGIVYYEFRDNLNLSPEISCFEIQADPEITVSDACYDSNLMETVVTLSRRLSEKEIGDLEFSFSNPQSNWICNSMCGDCEILSAGETKEYRFSMEGKPESVTLSIYQCAVENREIRDC